MATKTSSPNDQVFAGKTEGQIRAILACANPNALRMALFQATRNPELVAMQPIKEPSWGGAFLVSGITESDAEQTREMTLQYLLSGSVEPSPVQEAELRQMMGHFHGAPVDQFNFDLGRGDFDSEPFPLGVNWTNEPSDEVKRAFKVVVIGAGLAGLAASIQLKRLGIPHTVIERNAGVGGTWWTNRYPEARVDIASHHYQYSFMKGYRWKSYFATQADLLEYANEVVDRFDLQPNIQLNTEVIAANWDQSSCTWHIRTRDENGREDLLIANVLISAAGLFNAPNFPDIPGFDNFKGKMFHTTQWDQDYDYSNKRICQIGVGSTGAQLAPDLARRSTRLTIFQRSPQWVSEIPGYRDSISDEVQWLFDNVPHYLSWYSYMLQSAIAGDPEGLHNVDPEWQAQGGLISKRNDGLRAHNLAYIESKVGHDPELMRKVTPNYPPFAKRPVVDNGWFDALNRDNVELVTDPIARITPSGVQTRDGRDYDCDLLVICSGFKTERYLWPVTYRGVDGITLEQLWERDGARSYLGMTVPYFPNMFIVYGPNAQARSGGLIKWLEMWVAYSLKAVVHMLENGVNRMEVKPEVYEKYNEDMDKASTNFVWGMEGSKSYYLNDTGRQYVNMPWKPSQYYEWIRQINPSDYNVE